jgi:putative transposase
VRLGIASPDMQLRLRGGEDAAPSDRLRRAESIGRPAGDAAFMIRVEVVTGRDVSAKRRGPNLGRKD